MNNTDIIKADKQQVTKPYSPVTLTVYGKMVKLTANGSGSVGENVNGNPADQKKRA